jgi:hypothetical protein
LLEIKVLQEMKLLQINGKKFDFLQIEFLIFLLIIIGGLLDQLGLVDLILKYFTESENQSFLLNEAMCETMKTIGWKFGTTFSWNFIVMKAELSQN